MASIAILLISMLIILPQAMILSRTDAANGSIAMASIIGSFGDEKSLACAFLFLAAICAIAGVLAPRLRRFRVLFLVPQQFALFVYSAGALGAMMRESYADGVLRSWEFITSDQLFLVYVLAIHSAAISYKEIV